MKKFNSETSKDEFKELCTKSLPEIRSIEQMLEKIGGVDGITITICNDGYLSLDIHGGKWKMIRCKKDRPVKIIYENSEEINV